MDYLHPRIPDHRTSGPSGAAAGTGTKVPPAPVLRHRPAGDLRSSVSPVNEIESGTVTAGELMSTPVVAVTVDHSLAAAWEAMRHQRTHHVAVLRDSRVAAVLDDRTVAAEWPGGGPDTPHRCRVGDIVRPGPPCVLPQTPAALVARTMIEAGADAVPVVDRSGALIGLVTSTDLVAAVAAGVVPTGAIRGS